MRLIDADALKKELCKSCFGECTRECYEVALIKAQPTIEAEPVRRGHWVGIDDYPYETWECDQCGYVHEELGGWVPRYCPNCGAQMEVNYDD